MISRNIARRSGGGSLMAEKGVWSRRRLCAAEEENKRILADGTKSSLLQEEVALSCSMKKISASMKQFWL
jgi:hypothetical protein